MDFPRIDSALKTCEEHLATLDLGGPITVELESHLVAAMTILIVSEYEDFIEASFVKRADRCGDGHVANYVRSQLARRFRSPDLGKVNDVLGYFGQDYRESFAGAVENTPEHAAWDNIMRARHAVVHKQGSLNLTFRELKQSYEQTRAVIDRLVQTLGV